MFRSPSSIVACLALSSCSLVFNSNPADDAGEEPTSDANGVTDAVDNDAGEGSGVVCVAGECNFVSYVPTSSSDATQYTSFPELTTVGDVELENLRLPISKPPELNSARLLGLRFENLPIPPNAQVSRAQLEFTAASSGQGSIIWSAFLERSDSAPDFSGGLAQGRGSTDSCGTPQDNTEWNDVDESYLAPVDCAFRLSQLVSRTSWNERDNAIAFIIQFANATTTKEAYSFEGAMLTGEPTWVPRLRVTYADPSE